MQVNNKFVKFGLVSYAKAKGFGRNQQNRKIKHSHLQKIKRQCLESFDLMPPVTVNVLTDNLIDGQHREKAYLDLIEEGLLDPKSKLKVMYVEIPVEDEIQAIIDANTNSQSWTLDDYIASYAKSGLENYARLDDWCKMHTLSNKNGVSKFRYGAAIITGKRCASDLKKGSFTFTEDEYERANEVHAEMLEIVSLFKLKGKGSWIESLATSWIAVRNQHEFKVWIKELKAKKQKFMKLPKDNSRDWDNIFAQAHLAIDKKNC